MCTVPTDMVDEENRLREDDKPAVGSTSPPSTSQPHVQLDPCAGKTELAVEPEIWPGRPPCLPPSPSSPF